MIFDRNLQNDCVGAAVARGDSHLPGVGDSDPDAGASLEIAVVIVFVEKLLDVEPEHIAVPVHEGREVHGEDHDLAWVDLHFHSWILKPLS